MAWVNDLASVAGIPAGAVTLAVAMYAACTAAEKAASKQALADIGRILKDTTWERSVRPSAIIERVFNWTFGERHLSWKCVRRSSAVTLGFFCLMVALGSMSGRASIIINYNVTMVRPMQLVGFLLGFVLVGLIADYVALAKARYITKFLINGHRTIILAILDIIGSIVISLSLIVISFCIVAMIYNHYIINWNDFRMVVQGTLGWFRYYTVFLSDLLFVTKYRGGPSYIEGYEYLFPSTLFTSVWTILILLSTTVLKLLAPLHQFTAWFFDVEKHPVQAIGIVAGALVMIGSLIWTVLRHVI